MTVAGQPTVSYTYDIANRLTQITQGTSTVSFTYDVPGASWANSAWSRSVFNGWQVSSIMNFHSGPPFDETRSYLNLIGDPFAGVIRAFRKLAMKELQLPATAFFQPEMRAFPIPRPAALPLPFSLDPRLRLCRCS